MQGLEGELDTVHAAFLHGGAVKPEDEEPKSLGYYHYKERAPRFSVLDVTLPLQRVLVVHRHIGVQLDVRAHGPAACMA